MFLLYGFPFLEGGGGKNDGKNEIEFFESKNHEGFWENGLFVQLSIRVNSDPHSKMICN